MKIIVSMLVFLFFFGAGFSALRMNQEPEQIELSSVSAANLYSYELNAASAKFSNQMIQNQLDAIDAEWRHESLNETTRRAFVYTPEQLAEDEKKLAEPTEATTPVQSSLLKYEDTATCGPARLSVENIISKDARITDLIEERAESSALPRLCLLYPMNKTRLRPESYAKCPNGLKSLPEPGGNKPCVSKNMVNLTYNSYIDVLQCFGFNPRNITPKLFNESGFTVNTLGAGFDAGVAQFTIVGIDLVNAEYSTYIEEMKATAAKDPQSPCARVAKHLDLLTMASSAKAERCEFVSPSENPLRSFVYSAILNKINLKAMREKVQASNLEARIKQLGFQNVNMTNLTEALAMAAYNAGLNPPFNALLTYVEKREKDRIATSARDFDFYATNKATDIDGVSKDVLAIARSFVLAPFTSPKTEAGKDLKIQRTKLLQQKIDNSYKLSFPEHMIYHQTNLDEIGGTINDEFRVLGTPGYINYLVKKSEEVRKIFNDNGKGDHYCTNPDYLKMTR